jgi:pre-peptidase
MRRILCGAALAATLAPLLAAPARAQTPQPIRVGQTVNGSLAEGDPALSERGRFKVYRFTASKGQRLVATMRSEAFDAFLTVARSVGGITDAFKTDDDRGGGTDARVRFVVPEDGEYLLVAQSLAEEGVGAYTLALETAPEPTTAQSRELRLGQTVTGALAETDAILEEDDTFYDTWVISARAGQRLLIEMKSDSFDTFLSFGKMENDEFNATGTDDDGGDDTNSRLRVTVPENGEFLIRANSMGTATGPYTLTVTERPPPPPAPAPRPITVGQEVSGELSDDDAVMEDESYYDYYAFEGRAGDRLRITMRSDDFDTFLAFGRMEGGSFSEISTNDDGGEDGTNSQLEVTLPAAGRYVIRANSLSGGNTGAYTLKLERMP